MPRGTFKASYFTPSFKPRFKPKLGGTIGPQGISGTRIKPRILPTPVSGLSGKLGGLSGAARIPKINTSAAKAAKPALVTLTTKSSTGGSRAANPKPKTPSQLTGISSQPSSRPAKIPNSMVAQRPGVRTLQGAKMKVHRASPFRMPKVI